MKIDAARAAIARGRSLNAFISVTDETGEGVVVAVKDLIDVAGTVTTAGTAAGVTGSDPARQDAPLIAALRRQGGVVVGKTNLHELAFGTTSENEHFGAVGNPRFPDRVAGGSSGGSAAAVVAGMCDWAIGTDTGGSIRIPASFCGCVGFKPTRGTISTEGVFPCSLSLDTVGPLAPDVRTAARAVEMMTGGSFPVGRFTGAPRLAVPAGWIRELDEPTSRAWERVAAGLPEIQFFDIDELSGDALAILAWEFVEGNKALGDDQRVGLRGRGGIQFAASIRSDEGHKAALGRRPEQELLSGERLGDYDALLLPAVPVVAPKIGASGPDAAAVHTRFTVPFNATGQPVVCLPLPVGAGELPVGVQLVGRRGEDAALLTLAAALESRWAA